MHGRASGHATCPGGMRPADGCRNRERLVLKPNGRTQLEEERPLLVANGLDGQIGCEAGRGRQGGTRQPDTHSSALCPHGTRDAQFARRASRKVVVVVPSLPPLNLYVATPLYRRFATPSDPIRPLASLIDNLRPPPTLWHTHKWDGLHTRHLLESADKIRYLLSLYYRECTHNTHKHKQTHNVVHLIYLSYLLVSRRWACVWGAPP